MRSATLLYIGFAAAVVAHGDHQQKPIEGPLQSLWYNTLPGDGGTQVGPPPQFPLALLFFSQYLKKELF